ncbi:MAG: hypothetical protein FWC94_01045 [Bacteroidales bacterium]|nr:hypothetical protein [Bacteroidales bacterium]
MKNLSLKYFKNLSLSELGLVLLIPLASLSSRTWLPVPPTLLLFLGAVLCLFALYASGKLKLENRESTKIIVVLGIFILYIFSSQYFMGTVFFRYMGVVFAALYLILILIFSEQTSADFLKNLGRKFIRYSLIILCFEAILRFAYAYYLIIQGENPEHGFYQFKFNGPMYVASNMTAGHIIALLFFMLWWGHSYKESMKKEICVALILIVLTLSRASIPAVAIGLFYYFFFKNSDWKKSLLVLFSVGLFGIFALWALRYFPDYSFQTKFLILNEALYFYETASLRYILFGLGLSETEQMARFTFSAHGYFPIFLMETGMLGLLFLLTTFFFLIRFTNGAAMIVLLPYSIQILSEGATFIPYFYVIMAFMIVVDTRKINADNNQVNLSRS